MGCYDDLLFRGVLFDVGDKFILQSILRVV